MEAWLLSALTAFSPASDKYLRAEVAADTARGLSEPGEAMVRSVDWDGVLLMSIASFEGLLDWVDAGLCQSQAWRDANPQLLRIGDCDGGHALGVWQIHLYAGTSAIMHRDVKPENVIEDRSLAARIAHAYVRESFRRTGSLAVYTGEPAYHHPKATARLGRAERWMAAHHFPGSP